MALTVNNQKPTELNPVYAMPPKGDFDPLKALRETIVDPLFVPLTATSPAQILDDQNNPLDEDAVTQMVLRTLGGAADKAAEAEIKSLLQQTCIYYDPSTSLLTNELFATQAGARAKLPAPSQRVIYSATADIIPSAKALLAGGPAAPDTFFASLAFAEHPDTLGFYFLTSTAFDELKTWVANEAAALQPVLDAQTIDLFAQFDQLTLKSLTESLLLRQDEDENNEDFSFARTLVHLLLNYTSQVGPDQYGMLPFTLGELFCPKSLVFVNVERHARSTGKRVHREWQIINQSITSPVKMVSNKALNKLTALNRATARAAMAAANAASNRKAAAGRSGKVQFRKRAPKPVELANYIIRVLKRMSTVMKSMNSLRYVKSSYARSNRRSPDDFNKPGKSVSRKYFPDIHIYLDTSGSISEVNYQAAVQMLIQMAKKLNVNLYFNSFSHVLSETSLLKVENKSVAQIWAEFRKLPKVTGGTDFALVWNHINASNKRKREFSLMITDFGWSAYSTRYDHPKNLYYAPVADFNWDAITYYAKQFCESVAHFEPAIGTHLLGITN